jgi:LPXTG-motif cell wall-anchored protein
MINAQASQLAGNDDAVMLKDVLKDSNKNLLDEILIEENFDDALKEISLNGRSMLLVYDTGFGAIASEDLEAIIESAHNEATAEVVVLDDKPFLLFLKGAENKLWTASEYSSVPTFVQNIMNEGAEQMFLGQNVCVSNVYCFSLKRAYNETTVVYETDKGNFVRYYEHDQAEAVEYEWLDYVQKSIAYHEYSTSYENNYTPDGEPLYSGSVSFIEFCKNPSQYTVDEMQPKTDYTVLIIAIVGVAVIATAGILVYIRKKKR